jgi:KipI family sensor histidine kinase inhibitor
MTRAGTPRLSAIGEAALLFEDGGALGLPAQQRIWALAEQALAWPFVTDAVLGMTNLLVMFDPRRIDGDALGERLLDEWQRTESRPRDGRVVEIPVIYGGEFGPDLPHVAERAGLTPEDVVRLHTGADCTVYALGSSPGFAYLGGIPEAIFTPRRDVPILRAEGRSVMIGGAQTGVTWAAGPTGWHVIGRATLDVFDLDRDPPALLQPGDRVRFVAERIEP